MKSDRPIVAWVFELARAKNLETGEYTDWGKPQLSFSEPCVPDGSIRNLRALTYSDLPAATAEIVQGANLVGPDEC